MKTLETLVKNGTIKAYEIHNVDEDGIVGRTGKFRNSQLLIIMFNNGETLRLGTFCSGCNENTVFAEG